MQLSYSILQVTPLCQTTWKCFKIVYISAKTMGWCNVSHLWPIQKIRPSTLGTENILLGCQRGVHWDDKVQNAIANLQAYSTNTFFKSHINSNLFLRPELANIGLCSFHEVLIHYAGYPVWIKGTVNILLEN